MELSKLTQSQTKLEKRMTMVMTEFSKIRDQTPDEIGYRKNDDLLSSLKDKKRRKRVVSIRRYRVNKDGTRTLVSEITPEVTPRKR